MKKKILILIVFFSYFFVVGFTIGKLEPKEVYRVYISGKPIGLIESKEKLENYIDQEQQSIKRKYGVDKVYAPQELIVKKEMTYSNKISSIESIYNKIKDLSPFTIDGYQITINKLEEKNTKTKTQRIYCLKRNTFTKSVEKTVKSFVKEEDYDDFKEGKKKKIEDTGKIVENIYIKNKITIKKARIPVDKTIYTNEEDLSKYLLFGTTKPQAKYKVKEGDTIPDVAFSNKISNEEFLIANPKLKDENALLFPGQVVTLGIIKPQFSVVEEDHVVVREEKKYRTETKYDDTKDIGYMETTQKGVNGENRLTQKIQKVNGETTSVVTVSTEVLKTPINEVIVKGGKESYYQGGVGSPVPTKGAWGWPASCSTVSSGFGYRWGVLHDGTDIAGCGYKSNIFAAQAGTVTISGSKAMNGQYIVIDHHNGYFTMYAHLCVGCRYVKAGQNVVKGQVIGGMGQTGAATGVHLHFAIWRGSPYGRGSQPLNAMSMY